MRNIKYIVLHHSATDYQSNKDDVDGKLIGRTICDRAQEKWKKEYTDYKCDYHFIIGRTGEVFKAPLLNKQAGTVRTTRQILQALEYVS